MILLLFLSESKDFKLIRHKYALACYYLEQDGEYRNNITENPLKYFFEIIENYICNFRLNIKVTLQWFYNTTDKHIYILMIYFQIVLKYLFKIR